jgi:hypothetical protein
MKGWKTLPVLKVRNQFQPAPFRIVQVWILSECIRHGTDSISGSDKNYSLQRF